MNLKEEADTCLILGRSQHHDVECICELIYIVLRSGGEQTLALQGLPLPLTSFIALSKSLKLFRALVSSSK